MFKSSRRRAASRTSLMNEMIQNQKTVQAFSYGERALGRFDSVNEKLKVFSAQRFFIPYKSDDEIYKQP